MKYFIVKRGGVVWKEVDKNEFMRVEREEGFISQYPGEPATRSFGGKNWKGKVVGT